MDSQPRTGGARPKCACDVCTVMRTNVVLGRATWAWTITWACKGTLYDVYIPDRHDAEAYAYRRAQGLGRAVLHDSTTIERGSL